MNITPIFTISYAHCFLKQFLPIKTDSQRPDLGLPTITGVVKKHQQIRSAVTPSCHTQRLHLPYMQADFTPKSTLSLLIADDHALLREGLMLMFRTYEETAAMGVVYQDALSAVEQTQTRCGHPWIGSKTWPILVHRPNTLPTAPEN